MIVAALKEHRSSERRVAVTPETVRKMTAIGINVRVEAGAGENAYIPDEQFREAGAVVYDNVSEMLADADVVLKVQRPVEKTGEVPLVQSMKPGAVLIGMLGPVAAPETVQDYAKAGITAFSLEYVPRITRAQAMDVLSSQSNLAGYKAVLEAAYEFDRSFPMMMTAAGTVPPARVFVMGAGVAGLQAIATARRLGAIVSATDVRPAAREQVQSLGASFVMIESEETKKAETAGGYAKEMSEEYKQQQAELIAGTIKKQDIVICTALVPGRKAPILLTADMVHSMKPGSVIVDMAVEQGGNCELSSPGEIVEVNGVKIIGHLNMPSRLAMDASALYARNIYNFLMPLIDKEINTLKLNWDDEIIRATALTHDGKVIHPQFAPKTDETADEKPQA